MSGLNLNINSNLPGTGNAQRSAQSKLQKTMARLSSGMRINSAADDAAGLAISTRFTSQIRGYNTAIRNANDGISLTQVADGALSNTGENLQRIRELTVQAGNGILNDSDRKAIQNEIDQLVDEVDRVADTTQFNGKKLLDGSTDGLRLQIGTQANQTATVPTADASSGALGQAAVVEGESIDASGLQDGELSINGVDIRATQAADDTLSTTQSAGSAIAVGAAINDASEHTGVTATVNAAEATGGAVAGGTLDSDHQLAINGQTISGVEVQAGDAGDGLVEAINAVTDETGVTAALDAHGQVKLTAEDGRNIEVQTTGNAEAITGLAAGVTTGTVTLTSESEITVAGSDPADAGLAAQTAAPTEAQALSSVDVSDSNGVDRALMTIDRALGQVSRQRSAIGATQNRLTSTVNNLSAQHIAASEARSRVADADYAKESAEQLKASILSQASIAMAAHRSITAEAALTLVGRTG